MKTQIHITKSDWIKLMAIIDRLQSADERLRRWLLLLEQELDRANIVESLEISPTVVTLHSRVRLLDLDSMTARVYRLVMPDEADGSQENLSILAPIGIGMLGYGEGDVFECETPRGLRRFQVERVLFQPEADVLRPQRLYGTPPSREGATGGRA